MGAARFLSGLVQVVDPSEITAVVNTGDDTEMHGLSISPDLDTITYTLSGSVNPETGWGLSGESWTAMGALERIGGSERTWFRLGDRDLGTHLYRTGRLREGATLSRVSAEIAAAFAVPVRLLPMSDEPVRTVLRLVSGETVSFQEYFVKLRHDVSVAAVSFTGAEQARPAPGVLEAIAASDCVVFAPSNPVVSLAPVLAVPEIRQALVARRERAVAVSPIVGGVALKGPADRLLVEVGEESSALGVARRLEPFVDALVIDRADRELAGAIERLGLRAVVTDTVMRDSASARALADATLAAAGATA